MITTVKIAEATKLQLDQFKESRRESYDEIITKLIYVAKNTVRKPALSAAVIKEIDAARKRAAKGEIYSEEQAAKLLGI